MTREEAVNYFTNKYYELARKYCIYTKCRDNTKLMEQCVEEAIKCGVDILECETVDQISKEDLKYFRLIGKYTIEVAIMGAKRYYRVADRVTKGAIRKNGGVYGNKK